MPNERDHIEARVITVSREALRADLAEMRKDINSAMSEMELRITRNLAELLARKADLAMHNELEARVRVIEKDCIFRNGPAWKELREWVRELENTADHHDRMVPEFRALQELVAANSARIKSDAELRAMMREERGKAAGDQWGSVSKIIVLITTLVAVLGLWLAWNRATPSAKASEPSTPAAIQEGIPDVQ